DGYSTLVSFHSMGGFAAGCDASLAAKGIFWAADWLSGDMDGICLLGTVDKNQAPMASSDGHAQAYNGCGFRGDQEQRWGETCSTTPGLNRMRGMSYRRSLGSSLVKIESESV